MNAMRRIIIVRILYIDLLLMAGSQNEKKRLGTKYNKELARVIVWVLVVQYFLSYYFMYYFLLLCDDIFVKKAKVEAILFSFIYKNHS